MNTHEQDIHHKLETYSEYGRASLLFQGIVNTDTRETIRYPDDVRISHFQEKYQYNLSESVVSFVQRQLTLHRKERLFCVYKNADREAVIKAVTNEILRCYQANRKAFSSEETKMRS